MTPDLQSIAAVFRGRILELVKAAREYLEEVPERSALPIAELLRWRTRSDVAASLDASIASELRRETLGMPGTTRISHPDGRWGWPLPADTTFRDAVALAKDSTLGMAEELAEELMGALTDLLLPEPLEVRDLVTARATKLAEDWPLGMERQTDPRFRALSYVDAVVSKRDRRPPARLAWLEHPRVELAYNAREVARWAAPRMDAVCARDGVPLMGSEVLDYAESAGTLHTVSWRGRRFEGEGLALVFEAVRAARVCLFAVDAGREARRAALDLVGARNPGDEIYAALDYALDAEAERPDDAVDDWKGDPIAIAAGRDEGIRGGLAGELFAAAGVVARAVFTSPEPIDEAAARTGAGEAAESLAGALLRLGREKGAELAQDVRESAARRGLAVAAGGPAGELWSVWSPDATLPRRWLRLLARTLWADKWRPALARALRPVALPLFAFGKISEVLLARGVAPGSGGRDVLVDRVGHAVAPFGFRGLATQVDADALDRLARPGVGALTTIAAARFVPWFAEQVQRRPDEHAPLVFDGADGVNAWGSVAVALGMDPKNSGEVRGMIHALQATVIQYPDGAESGVLMFDYRPGGGRGNPSRLRLTPGRPWLADDVHNLPEGAEYRALAPIPRLEGYAPPFVGDRRERAALARLWLCLLVELTREAPDLSLGLGANIPTTRWAELALTVGVLRPPPFLVGLLQERWSIDGHDGAAVLERVGPDRWHLAPRFEAERAMLEAGGRMRRGAAEGGRRAARGRAEERGRLADGLPRKPKGRRGS